MSLPPTGPSGLLEALGEGGVSEIRSLQSRPLTDTFVGRFAPSGERVFVKALRAEEPKIRANFRREISVLRALGGRRGCPVLLAAGAEEPHLFHVCRLARGTPFGAPGDAGPALALDDLLRQAAALADWLASLHAIGFAHRDLSPDHVLVDGDGAFTVVDFGMAKPVFDRTDGDAAFELAYDVQALGMTLWEAICGIPLFPYRGEALAGRIAAESAVVENSPLPRPLIGILRDCFNVPSEFTRDWTGADIAASAVASRLADLVAKQMEVPANP